jgi:hypothetical protein
VDYFFCKTNRIVLQKAKQVAALAEGIKDVQDPNDTRIKNLGAKLDQLVQEAQKIVVCFKPWWPREGLLQRSQRRNSIDYLISGNTTS